MTRIHLAVGVVVLFAVVAPSGTVHGQPAQAEDFTVYLRGGNFVPAAGVNFQIPDVSTEFAAEPVHVYVQLRERASMATRRGMAADGITLLAPASGTVYIASISRDRAGQLIARGLEAIADPAVRQMTRAIFGITADQKLEPSLVARRYYPTTVNADGTLRVIVTFHRDSSVAFAESAMRAFAQEFEPHGYKSWYVNLRPDDLARLAGEDAVLSIEQETPIQPLADKARALSEVETAQGADLATSPPTYDGLSGRDIRVAVMDGAVDADHKDFWNIDAFGHKTGSRLAHEFGGIVDVHGTHVAGVIGGSGYQSMPNGGMAYQWRGMAPQATLLSFSQALAQTAIYYDALVLMKADVTNHSYVQTCTGYNSDVSEIDRIVRGDGVHILPDASEVPLPARTFVWGIGNNGYIPTDCLSTGVEVGYFTAFAPSKNPIVVGAINSDDSTSSDDDSTPYLSSGLGPTFDGRIKPDVVAPGCERLSAAGGIKSTDANTNGYDYACGTSVATAVVSGVVALLLEEWRDRFSPGISCLTLMTGSCHPFPSTMKAVLIQSATDLKDPTGWITNFDTGQLLKYFRGPDFATGYGRINAKAARDIVAAGPGLNRRIVEAEISTESEEDSYWITVPEDQPTLRVTLAWDDDVVAALSPDPNAKALVNDLDLELVRPDGMTTHLPWTLPALDPADIIPIQHAVRNQPDHDNNVEQVEVDNPPDGQWTIRVRGSDTLWSPQNYSLVADYAIIDTGLLTGPELELQVCIPLDWVPTGSGIQIDFPATARCGYIPVGPMCRYAIICRGCEIGGACDGRTVLFRGVPEFFELAVYDDSGNRVASEAPLANTDRRTRRLEAAADRSAQSRDEQAQGSRYRLFFFPREGARPGGTYTIGLDRL